MTGIELIPITAKEARTAIHHPDRLTRLFAFAGNSDPSGVKDVSKSPVFTAYIQRAAKEYTPCHGVQILSAKCGASCRKSTRLNV